MARSSTTKKKAPAPVTHTTSSKAKKNTPRKSRAGAKSISKAKETTPRKSRAGGNTTKPTAKATKGGSAATAHTKTKIPKVPRVMPGVSAAEKTTTTTTSVTSAIRTTIRRMSTTNLLAEIRALPLKSGPRILTPTMAPAMRVSVLSTVTTATRRKPRVFTRSSWKSLSKTMAAFAAVISTLKGRSTASLLLLQLTSPADGIVDCGNKNGIDIFEVDTNVRGDQLG